MAKEPGSDRTGPRRGFDTFRAGLAEEGRVRPRERRRRGSSTPERKRSDRPNVLWLMADQLRADTMGCMGHPSIQTPNMDRVAGEGAVFTNSFAGEPVCMPSRATFLTGHYPGIHGVLQNGIPMRESEVAFPTLLKEAGWRTANIGKSHCGRNSKDIWEYTEYVEDVFGATKPSKVAFDPEVYPELTFIGNEVCDNSDRVLYGKYPGPPQTSKSYILASQAMMWLYWHDDPRPFFLRVSFDDPHPPVVPPEPYASMYGPDDVRPELLEGYERSLATKPSVVREYREFTGMSEISEADHRMHAARYLGLVSHLDAQMGRIIDYLDEIGVADNTIVIINSDHGHMIGEHGLSHKGPLCYEGTARVPTIVRWPGRLEAGKRIDALADGVDFMPTVLDMLDVDIPQDAHGHSLLPVLEGKEKKVRDYAFIEWDDFGFCIRGERWKLTWWDSDQDGELYDLAEDPLEKNNLYHEPGVREVRDDLLERLNEWRGRYGPHRAVENE